MTKDQKQAAINAVEKKLKEDMGKPDFFQRHKKKLIVGSVLTGVVIGGIFSWKRWGGSLHTTGLELAQSAAETVTE